MYSTNFAGGNCDGSLKKYPEVPGLTTRKEFPLERPHKPHIDVRDDKHMLSVSLEIPSSLTAAVSKQVHSPEAKQQWVSKLLQSDLNDIMISPSHMLNFEHLSESSLMLGESLT